MNRSFAVICFTVALDAMGGVDVGAVEAADYGDDDEDDVYDDEDDPFGLPGGRFYGR